MESMDHNNSGFQHLSYGLCTQDLGSSYQFVRNTNPHNAWAIQPMEPNLGPPNHTNPFIHPLSHSATPQYQQPMPHMYLNPGIEANYQWSNPMIANHQFYQVASAPEPPLVINPHPTLQNGFSRYVDNDPNHVSFQASPLNRFAVQDLLQRPSENRAMLVQELEQPLTFREDSLEDLPTFSGKNNSSSQDRLSEGRDAEPEAQTSSREFIKNESVSPPKLDEGTIIGDTKKQDKITPKKKLKNSAKVKTFISTPKVKTNKILQKKTTLPGDLRELLTKTSKVMKDPIVRKQNIAERNVTSVGTKPSVVSSTLKKQRSSKLLQMLEPLLRMNYSIRLKSTGQLDGSSRYTISLTKKRKQPIPNRLSPLYDSADSVLMNISSYRLTSRFALTGKSVTDSSFAHNICPHDYICLPDLIGTCPDKSCLYQHRSNYLMTDIEKLADILSYKPSLTGFKSDASLSQGENAKNCRIKLKQYAAKLIAKNSDKTVETITQNLLRYVRGDKPDHELLVMRRKLPKVSQLSLSAITDNSEMQRKASIKSLANRLSALEKTQAKLQKTYK